MVLKLVKSRWLNLTMAAALIALAVAGHRYSPQLLPKTDAKGVADPGCNLQQRACSAALPDGRRLELSITPRPIAFLHPLRVAATIAGTRPEKLEVDFAGETMNMGYNRIELTATGPGSYAGEASLPVCVSGGMTWMATVIIETGRQRIAIPYRFEIDR